MIAQPIAAGGPHFPSGIIVPILFPFFFVGMWCLVCKKISQEGWSDLAQTYRCDRTLSGKLYSGRSGRFSLQGSYSRILNVRLCEEGIGLSVMLPWRMGHPPLLIPWSKVVGIEERSVFFVKSLQITISHLSVTFRFGLPLSAKVELDTKTLGFRGPLYHRKPPPLFHPEKSNR